jgi:DNA-binding IclR family transcriptional regulator
MARSETVKSARRALEILERFALLQHPAGVGELAKELQYPLSSTSVLVSSLTQLGYLSYDAATRKFAPSLRVALLGDWILDGDVGRTAVKKLVQDARRLTGVTAVLATRNGVDVQYIHVVKAPESNFLSRRPGMGTLRPILRGSAGAVLLAEMTDQEIALIVRRVNATSARRVPLDVVMQHVNDARTDGCAFEIGGVFPDVGSVSIRIPIDDMFGKPLVLSVAGSAQWASANRARTVKTLRRLIRRFDRLRDAAPVAGESRG